MSCSLPFRVDAGDRRQRRRGAPSGRRSSLGGAPSYEASGEGPRSRPVSLADLIGAGLLEPGHDVVSVAYKGATHSASLTADGSIEWRGRTFSSASAFTIAVKRLATPEKQGDDGWKSAVYRGRTLDDLRQEFRTHGDSGRGDPASGPASSMHTTRSHDVKGSQPAIPGRQSRSSTLSSSNEDNGGQEGASSDGEGAMRPEPDASGAAEGGMLQIGAGVLRPVESRAWLDGE